MGSDLRIRPVDHIGALDARGVCQTRRTDPVARWSQQTLVMDGAAAVPTATGGKAIDPPPPMVTITVACA